MFWCGLAAANLPPSRLDYTALLDRWGHPLDGYGYAHDLLGLRTNIVRELGITTNSVAVGYDAIGQLISWKAKEMTGASRLHEQLGWSYDKAGNLLYRTNGAFVQLFTNNPINQLTNISRTGNLTVSGTTPAPASSVTVNGQSAERYGDFTFARTNLSLTGNDTFTIIAQNQFGSATNSAAYNLPSSISLTHDANGNLTSDGTRSFFYNAENRLTNITVTAKWKAEFVYDGLSRRRIMREYGWQGGQWVKTNEVRFVWDGFLPIQERDGNNLVKLSYTRGPDLSGSLQGAGGIGGLLARTDSAGNSIFYHADGAGNITALMDMAGNVSGRYQYGPFGRLTGMWGPMAGANVMRFSSMPYYEKSGISAFAFRDYDPTLQRFLTQDPIGELGGINLYGFVGNNPINRIDPLGLFDPATGTAIGIGLTSGTASSGGAGLTLTYVGGSTASGLGLGPLAGGGLLAGGGGYLIGTILQIGRDAEINPTGVNGSPAKISFNLPIGYVLRPGEYRDQEGNVRDAAGNLVRDRLGRDLNEGGKASPPCSTFRDMLTKAEQAEFEALRAKYPGWMPGNGLDTPATLRSVSENAAARAEFTGRGHHPQPLKFGGEPNPPDLMPTGESRTEKNPIHTEITSFWNRVLHRINSESLLP